MTLTIGQQGNLKGETLTVVSISGATFKCDNGKTYLIKNAFWMTEPKEAVAVVKVTPRIKRELTSEGVAHLAYLELTGNDMVSLMNKSTQNYRIGKAGMSSLTK